jgi:hypothetical protein
LSLKAAFSKGFRAKVFISFPNIVAYNLNHMKNKSKIDKLDFNSIAGFSAADGSFSIYKPSITK